MALEPRGRHVIPSLKREAQRLGVNPARVLPLPRADDRAGYLALLQGCDALADAREFNAHTTAADALYAGVPVVTLPGAAARWVGRVGASLAEGLPTGVVVARSWQDYQRTLRAVLRARDRAARRLARALNDAPLFSGAVAWRARLAAALALAFDAHCSGAAPRSAVALAEGWPAP
jgi:protein O-GlcNAc transferase